MEGMAQVVECLPSNHEALSSILDTMKKFLDCWAYSSVEHSSMSKATGVISTTTKTNEYVNKIS
jgi:hypothetical protein